MTNPSDSSGASDADENGHGSDKSVPRRTAETCKEFQYEELFQATNGFSPSNEIGRGGFGCVYKGTIAGNLVAVKELRIGSEEGFFLAEVNIISTVHHRHLVSLVGYCSSDIHKLLVYEYVPNGTVSEALHGHGKPCMNWGTRMKIALGTAKGLAYLHDDCRQNIIHRDIKSDNILLNDQWEAQVADFGLAKVKDHAQTHVSTRAMGTFGYMAPEFVTGGKLTDKADVYSFGVVLLELITGKKAIFIKTLGAAVGQEESLVEWARPLLSQALKTQNVVPLADPNLIGVYDKKEMFAMVAVAAACVRHSSLERPKMAAALYALATPDEDIYQGSTSGYYSGQLAGGESSEDLRKKLNQAAFGSLISEDLRDEVPVETPTKKEKSARDDPSAPSENLRPPKPQNMENQQTEQQKPEGYQQKKPEETCCQDTLLFLCGAIICVPYYLGACIFSCCCLPADLTKERRAIMNAYNKKFVRKW